MSEQKEHPEYRLAPDQLDRGDKIRFKYGDAVIPSEGTVIRTTYDGKNKLTVITLLVKGKQVDIAENEYITCYISKYAARKRKR